MAEKNRASFAEVAKHLSGALKSSGDRRLKPFFAEYSVASKLEEHGHKVNLPRRIGADLELLDIPKMVEVKSGELDNPNGWECAASFGDGHSISDSQFHYCIFVVFENLAPKEYLIFTLEDLKEIPKRRVGAFPNNPCLLFRNVEDAEDEPLEIEVRLHEHPEQFVERWDKIK